MQLVLRRVNIKCPLGSDFILRQEFVSGNALQRARRGRKPVISESNRSANKEFTPGGCRNETSGNQSIWDPSAPYMSLLPSKCRMRNVF